MFTLTSSWSSYNTVTRISSNIMTLELHLVKTITLPPSPLPVQISITFTCAELALLTHKLHESHRHSQSLATLGNRGYGLTIKGSDEKRKRGPNVNWPPRANTASLPFFFDLLALMDDDDNECRAGILCVLFVMVYHVCFEHCCGTMPHCHLVAELWLVGVYCIVKQPPLQMKICLTQPEMFTDKVTCYSFIQVTFSHICQLFPHTVHKFTYFSCFVGNIWDNVSAQIKNMLQRFLHISMWKCYILYI